MQEIQQISGQGEEALRELARDCRISLGYHDAFGQWREPDPAALRALLEALGHLAPGGSAEDALKVRENARWLRFAPPVRVIEAGQPLSLELCVPAGGTHDMLHWSIRTETDEQHDGHADLATLAVLEEGGSDGQALRRVSLMLDVALEAGYHRLEIRMDRASPASLPLIVSPARCYLPEVLDDGGRLWGPAFQLYALRSARNWGMGDFADLKQAMRLFSARGAGLFGLNPMHAPFLSNPAHASPYSPCSRLFLNPLYLAVESVEDFAACALARQRVESPEFQGRLRRLRDAEKVDYTGVAAAKLEILALLWARFRDEELARATPRAAAYLSFMEQGGELLRRHCLFESLHEHLRESDETIWNARSFPADLASADAEATAKFAEEASDAVGFHAYLQWQAALQLGECEALAESLGAPGGLYLDLAVSCDGGGSDAWGEPGLFVSGLSVGAPPDDFNPRGQDWGLPPLHPDRLREDGYRVFIQLLRASMSRAGALRIDHVMGLLRLYCVPRGFAADQGIYVYQVFEELLGIVALESQRNRCLIVGEDLGTVPDEVRSAMHRLGMLSYRLFYFEKEWSGEFLSPERYPREALVAVSTHDLPTLAGWWLGRDLELRKTLRLFPSPQIEERQTTERTYDRYRLLRALRQDGLLPEGVTEDPMSLPVVTPEVSRAVHARLARAPSRLMVLQMEDVFGQVEQANLPGTTEVLHPNWQRKIAVPLEEWADHPLLVRMTEVLEAQRSGL